MRRNHLSWPSVASGGRCFVAVPDRELAAMHPAVLVNCYAGRSRSAAVVCRYFMLWEGTSLGEAMRRITSKRKAAIEAGLQECWIVG